MLHNFNKYLKLFSFLKFFEYKKEKKQWLQNVNKFELHIHKKNLISKFRSVLHAPKEPYQTNATSYGS